jgi:dihydrofolate reductase
MRRLSVFNQVSIDGYFTDANGDMSWAHKRDAEWTSFGAENASGGGVLVFGRITYDLMASFWPTPQAFEVNPVVAERMNNLPKIVCSRTMFSGSKERMSLGLRRTRTFSNGNVVLWYAPSE